MSVTKIAKIVAEAMPQHIVLGFHSYNWPSHLTVDEMRKIIAHQVELLICNKTSPQQLKLSAQAIDYLR
jgi:hypothetical protein